MRQIFLLKLSVVIAVVSGDLYFHTVGAQTLDPIQIVAPSQNNATSFEVGDVPLGEFTGTYAVIEEEELQQTSSSLAAVVAEGVGVQFRQSGGPGSFSTISLRGSTAQQVNVYLDGILLNEAAGGGVNLSHVELMQADRVEVYRGAIPVQLGDSAIGGAVNITSNRATAAPSTRLLAGFGSFGTSKFSVSYAGPVSVYNRLPVSQPRLVASFAHRKSNNDFEFVNDNGTELNPDDDAVEKRINAGTESTSGFLKSGFSAGENSRFEQSVQVDSNTRGIANWRNTGGATLGTDSVQWRAALTRNSNASSAWSTKLGIHYSTKEELYDNSNGSVGLGLQNVLTDSRVVGGSGYWERVRNTQSFSLNVKTRVETLQTRNQLRSGSSTNAQRIRADMNLQWNRFYSDGDSLLSLGILGFSVNDEYDTARNSSVRQGYSADALSPQIGINHSLGKLVGGYSKLLVNASVQKRSPTFFELFGNQGLVTGNPTLRTETSRNVDLGVEWTSAASAAIDASMQLVWFNYQREDLITRVYNAQGVGRSENISAAHGSGIELSGLVALDGGFELDASVTFQDAENRSIVRGFRGKQLPGEASLDGALRLRWKNPVWGFEYTYKVNRDRFYDSANNLPAADQQIHSINVSRRFAPWRLAFELNNIGNHNYEDFNGYPKPGRAGFFTLTYKP